MDEIGYNVSNESLIGFRSGAVVFALGGPPAPAALTATTKQDYPFKILLKYGQSTCSHSHPPKSDLSSSINFLSLTFI